MHEQMLVERQRRAHGRPGGAGRVRGIRVAALRTDARLGGVLMPTTTAWGPHQQGQRGAGRGGAGAASALSLTEALEVLQQAEEGSK